MPYYVVDDQTKIYYEETGKDKKETIMILHGLGSSHLKIKNFIDKFKSQYHVIYYDHRGHCSSDISKFHINIERLAKDLNELIEYLDLKEINIIGHSMGAATIYNYINQFGTSKLKSVTAVDMSPYLRNHGWKGGIARGTWTDEDYFKDFDNIFDDVGKANWIISKETMNPELKKIPKEFEQTMINSIRNDIDPFIMVGFWYALFRLDQRPFIKKIDVPFLYIMPDFPLYSMETVNFYKDNVKGKFKLEKNFPKTTHLILMEQPKEVAESIKKFIQSNK